MQNWRSWLDKSTCFHVPGLLYKLRCLNNRNLFPTVHFWRLEVQNQGLCRSGFIRGLSPELSDGHLAVSSHGLCLVCAFLVSVSQSPTLTRTPVRLASFLLNYPFKRPCLQIYHHILRNQKLGHQHKNWGGGCTHNSARNSSLRRKLQSSQSTPEQFGAKGHFPWITLPAPKSILY